jgi:hypothetical protein
MADARAVTGCRLLLAGTLLAATAATQAAAWQITPHRDPLLMPKDCRFERDKARCVADNRAIDFCRDEKDAKTVYICLRANQSPLACEDRTKAAAKSRCERMNRVYQPCKGMRGDELAACVDRRRAQEKRKK